MYWPPQSPDLNPIENLWDELERKLRGSSPFPITYLIWRINYFMYGQKIDHHSLKKLVDSMPSQMKAVIKAMGGPVDY